MELVNDFSVPVPIDEAWAILTDLERIAPCMPGAQLTEVEGEDFHGVLKIKLGPIQAQYKGTARFASLDEAGRSAVISASGRDARQGSASAEITAELEEVDGATQVRLVTDLTLSGKIAQFSRGVLPDVSAKLLAEFVANLEAEVLVDPAGEQPGPTDEPAVGAAAAADSDQPAAEVVATVSPSSNGAAGRRVIDGPEAQPVDLLETAGAPVAKRLAPLVVLVLVVLLLRRRSRRRPARPTSEA